MAEILTQLDEPLKKAISASKEICIACALASDYAIDVLDNSPKSASVRCVIGTNLPTPSAVLKSIKEKSSARIYVREFFHPKVYLCRKKDDSFIAFVGSGNFTAGGLKDNVEMTVQITEQSACQSLYDWFNALYDDSIEITESFLAKYKPIANDWHSFKRMQERQIKELNEHTDKISSDLNGVKKELKKIMDSLDYDVVKDRQSIIKKIKDAIDFNNDFKSIDIDAFLEIKELGHILQFNKKALNVAKENGELRKLFKLLCDNSKSIEYRYNMAVTKMKVEGCGPNIITKIMLVNNPKECLLWNQVTADFCKDFEITFERGLSAGEKYKKYCLYFKSLMKDVGIPNFAVLDEYLYTAVHSKD